MYRNITTKATRKLRKATEKREQKKGSEEIEKEQKGGTVTAGVSVARVYGGGR